MEDLNKITSTRVGDSIHFFVNGAEDSGTVVKMDTSYVTVVKRDGNFQDIHINDTFFIKDILVNKSWNDMTMEERTVELHKVHAYSPRFLAKSWKELPKELKDVMKMKPWKANPRDPEASSIPEQVRRIQHDSEERGETRGKKQGKKQGLKQGQSAILNAPKAGLEILQAGKKKSNVEQGHLGSAGRGGHAVETNTDFDAPDDYEGQTEDEKKEQFKHEDKKPQTTDKSTRAARGGHQLSGTTLRPSDIKDLQNLDGSDKPKATPTSETKYFGANGKQITREEHEKTKTYGSMQEQLWEQWLDKDGGMGGGSPPASTSSNNSAQTNDSGVYNPVYGDKGRHGGQGRDKEEEDEDKDDKDKQQ
jgi:hypothetical protein